MTATGNQWTSTEHALAYLSRADQLPHRMEGEAVLLDLVPQSAQRLLDLGTGDGRLLSLLRLDRPQAECVALDFSPTMLAAARDRFAGAPQVTVIDHNLDQPLPDLGLFDAIVSSFAIHHLSDARKRSLYGEIGDRLTPSGIFANLEHVAPVSDRWHRHFLTTLGYAPDYEDPSNILLDVETQLRWLRELGFQEVDCYWKWLEMALLVGFQ
ncbi:MAG: class I SAM-dependent methyltransferase [Spirulinaceae cyanobacterium SM2_1_0]|nr:class I SAM-dependent methyltransferase [Spirulinaceae cyanobacterium SM2_1_0]